LKIKTAGGCPPAVYDHKNTSADSYVSCHHQRFMALKIL